MYSFGIARKPMRKVKKKQHKAENYLLKVNVLLHIFVSVWVYTGYIFVNHFNFVSFLFPDLFLETKNNLPPKKPKKKKKESKKRKKCSNHKQNNNENGTVPCTAYSHHNDDKCYDWSRNVILEISNKTHHNNSICWDLNWINETKKKRNFNTYYVKFCYFVVVGIESFLLLTEKKFLIVFN